MLQMKLLSRVVSDLELEDLWYISPTLNSCTLETKAVWYCPGDGGGGGGGTPLYGLYGDVPLDRLWFLAPLP